MKSWLFTIPVLLLAIGVSVGAHGQNFSVVYKFGANSADPLNPLGSLVQGRDGNLYGMSGSGANGMGTLFKINSQGEVTVLNENIFAPVNGLTLGIDGNFYGATVIGGTDNYGTLFKVTPSGTLTVLHNFKNGTDGINPEAPPIQGKDRNFYGVTLGGTLGHGTIYKLTPSGKFSTIYRFDSTHGENPYAALVQGTDSNYYGSTIEGGTNGLGTIFKVSPSGKLKVIRYLNSNYTGNFIISPLVQGNDGYFYGTALGGGEGNKGSVFKISSQGKFTPLGFFNGPSNGAEPAGLVEATDGNFYGAAELGGGSNYGTLYQVTSSRGSLSVLHYFANNDGAFPYGPVQHTNGTLYGTTGLGGMRTDACDNGCGVFYGLDMGLGPFVSFLPSLSSGRVGTTIQLFGQGFKGATAVSFNGTPASFSVKSNTYMTAVVPSGATTGFVVVSSPGGNLTSNKQFRVISKFTSFNPTDASDGNVGGNHGSQPDANHESHFRRRAASRIVTLPRLKKKEWVAIAGKTLAVQAL
jgi:uncharacterized repeat protein (TIGR03803 family)